MLWIDDHWNCRRHIGIEVFHVNAHVRHSTARILPVGEDSAIGAAMKLDDPRFALVNLRFPFHNNGTSREIAPMCSSPAAEGTRASVDLVWQFRDRNHHSSTVTFTVHSPPPQSWKKIVKIPDLGGLKNDCPSRIAEFKLRHYPFERWLDGLKDVRAQARIVARIARLEAGNAGDVRPIGAGLSEMRVDYGPGYRVYFMSRGVVIIALLCGGDKSTQRADLTAAKRIAAQFEE